MSDTSSSDDSFSDVVVYTPDEILRKGLRLVNYSKKRIRRAKKVRNIERFKGHYGSEPVVVAQIFEDLQRTDIPEAYLPPSDAKINLFLMAMHHLKRYPTELEREPIFDIDAMQGRDWVWFFLEKVQALKAVKICWPDDNFGSDIWVVTVDGTHCWITEPRHPEWSQDSRYYSHKFGKAGVGYELGIAIATSRLVWMNGPYPAGDSDLRIFKRRGLKKKLTEANKRGIADSGYPGYPTLLSTPNNHDSKEVKRFKSRALKRHENFNGMTKTFDCLSGRFRHGSKRFETCFEAVCVVCQYQLENGHPLYDVLIDGLSDN
jgi:hypothetical protein